MPNSKEINALYDSRYIQSLIEDLEETTDQVENLLISIQNGQIEFAVIKTELHSFMENVKDLSAIIKNENNGHSLLTRIAILEKTLEELIEWKKEEAVKQLAREPALVQAANTTGKWQLIAAATTGSIALIASIISMIITLLAK